MRDTDRKTAAKQFIKDWAGKGYEKGQSQPFWLQLLRNVYGVENPEQYISFEDQVMLDHTSFIDGYIPETKVMIEQKSLGKSLNKPIRQSDGTMLNPFQQAKRYIADLPVSKHPRWVITCNFEEFYIYDMERPGGDPEIVKLADLEKEYYRLDILIRKEDDHIKKEMEVSIAAGEIVGLLYDALAKQYADFSTEKAMKSLNVLCVRLVFCLYAEDAGIFGRHGMFHDYLASYDVRKVRKALRDLFKVLDQPEEARDPYLADDDPLLAEFPYVNGGLFANEEIEIPPFNEEIMDLLLNKASADFDWSQISPTIFGAVFESTLNPDTRRKGGMHYTSIENIHKVIDPLFLDDLKKELADLKAMKTKKTRENRLRDFQNKLASLCWLDPAAGSGNFLTETYISVRKLENEVLRTIYGGQITIGVTDPIKVSIGQFYGIEINDFAVTVAKTALWIAESQMLKETEGILAMQLNFLPLTTNATIIEGNALQLDWEKIVPKQEISYIMGNPPFVGMAWMSKEQKKDLQALYVDNKKAGTLDYVSGWYLKALQFMKETRICAAFVSTNSITQGEQIGAMWKYLFDCYNINIIFAHRNFVWNSEAKEKAAVHCVIIGFCLYAYDNEKYLYEGKAVKKCSNINPYLVDADNVFVERRRKPLYDIPEIHRGNQPTDGGNLIIEADEYEEFINKEPKAVKFIKRYMMGYEFINNKKRYCLWLVDASPKELKEMPFVMKRVQKVREMRKSSSFAPTRKMADTPTLFRETFNPDQFIAIPKVSSERRRYIPMGYLDNNTIPGDKLFMIENAGLYHFGVLESNVHMAWMRAVCGRLEMRYSYSKDIVYNNFPWLSPTQAQQERIEQTAQAILDARDLYPDSSLADLYDELTMPPELRKAHQRNDLAVMAAYGFTRGTPAYSSESACVAELMKLYQKKVSEIG